MSLVGEKVLLRAYLQSADRSPHTPTYERVVKAARKAHLAGATVLRGMQGAGYHGIIKPSTWSFVEHVPIIVEIVDDGNKIAQFVRGPLDQIMVGGMLTLERAAVMMYRSRRQLQRAGVSSGGQRKCPNCGTVVAAAADFCPRCGHRTSDIPLIGERATTGALGVAKALEPLSTLPDIQPGPHMRINENGILLRVFIGESDKIAGKPLYEAIVQKVRELGLAGATVLRGTEGFGANSVVHKAALLEMSTDLPVIIEIVDTEDNIGQLLPHLEAKVQEGMITMEYVIILMYRHDQIAGTTIKPPKPAGGTQPQE